MQHVLSLSFTLTTLFSQCLFFPHSHTLEDRRQSLQINFTKVAIGCEDCSKAAGTTHGLNSNSCIKGTLDIRGPRS